MEETSMTKRLPKKVLNCSKSDANSDKFSKLKYKYHLS